VIIFSSLLHLTTISLYFILTIVMLRISLSLLFVRLDVEVKVTCCLVLLHSSCIGPPEIISYVQILDLESLQVGQLPGFPVHALYRSFLFISFFSLLIHIQVGFITLEFFNPRESLLGKLISFNC